MSRAPGACGRLAARLALALCAIACTDVAVVGESSACAGGCDQGLLCESESGRCVQCMGDVDCGGDAPWCSTDHACVECRERSDCGHEQRCVTGTCVAEHEEDDDGFTEDESEEHASELEGDAAVRDAESEGEEQER